MARLVVKEVAEKQGLNQSQLQIRAGVTPALLNRYWRNATESITLVAFSKIARALGVSVRDLLVDDGERSGKED